MPVLEYAVRVPFQVPFFGAEGDEVDASIPELDAYLKARYPKIQKVQILYRNPRPEIGAALHDAWIVVVVFNPFTKRMAERFGDDVYKWMKKRWKQIKRGHKPQRSTNARKHLRKSPRRSRHDVGKT